MSSTFHGLEVARRALSAQQSALYTTSHNIANVNTEGYSRQRVNLEQTAPYPPASRNRPQMAGQVGSGVEASSVERMRNQFLDVQYRSENSKLGYYEAKTSAMQQMETVMNEPSEQGLAKTMDRFWQSLQDLSANPENTGARAVVRERGVAVAETFQYLSNSLQGIRTDLRHEMDVTRMDANSLMKQVGSLNDQISKIEPHGYRPNDLYDERDRLIDELSSIMDIKVSYTPSGGNANPMAMGEATITLAGGSVVDKLVLVDGAEAKELHINFDDQDNVEGLTFTGQAGQSETVEAADFTSRGKLKGLMEANGYTRADEPIGTFPDMLSQLDQMAFAFSDAFNNVHKSGAGLDNQTGVNFFIPLEAETGAAAAIKVSEVIIKDANAIAASSTGGAGKGARGDGSNALALAGTMNEANELLKGASVQDFYESVIGGMAVNTQETSRLADNATVLKQQVTENRQSISAVSLDEEMTNMIKFQHAYNAAARSMTTIDQMLDTIINRMGVVGR